MQLLTGIAILVLVSNFTIGVVVVLQYMRLKKISSSLKSKIAHGRLPKSVTKRIEKKIEEEIAKILADYSKSLNLEAKKYATIVGDLTTKQGRDLSAFIAQQQKSITSETQYLVANHVVRVEKELDIYKQDRLKAIDTHVNKLVSEVARKVLGKTIDISTHEELVKEALERAKEENFFSHGKAK